MDKLNKIYEILYNRFGPQYWWPGKTKFEIIVGAILTQNTSWNNVEKAISSLKRAKLLSPEKIYSMPLNKLSHLIRSSGFYNQKAKRLNNFCTFLKNNFNFNLYSFLSQKTTILREELLELNGIGPETADSIILYAANKPKFVIDAYTFRLCKRLGINTKDDYHYLQSVFEKRLPKNVKLYNEFHALIVKLAKEYCKKKPVCIKCPLHLKKQCKYNMTRKH